MILGSICLLFIKDSCKVGIAHKFQFKGSLTHKDNL